MAVAIPIPYRNPYYEVLMDIGGGKKTALDITKYVTSLAICRSMKKTDSLTVMATDNIESLSLIGSNRLIAGTKIFYRYGYVSWRMSSWRVARITEVEPTFGLVPTIKIECSDFGVPMKKISSNKIYYNMTSSQICSEICAKYGLKTFIEPTTKKYDAIAVGHRTDFQFIKYLASRESGNMQAYLTGDEFYYYSKKNGTKSVTTFAYGDYEVFRFAVSYNTRPVAADADEANSLGIDPLTGEIKKSTSKGTNVGEKKLAANTEFIFDAKTGKYVYYSDGARKEKKLSVDYVAAKEVAANTKTLENKFQSAQGKIDKELEKFLKGENTTETMTAFLERTSKIGQEELATAPTSYEPSGDVDWVLKKAGAKKDKNKNKILTGKLEAHLNPLLELDDIVTIDNVTKRYSGNWWIWEINDTIDSNGGISNVELGRNHYDGKKEGSIEDKESNLKAGPTSETTAKKEIPIKFSAITGKQVK